MLSNIYPTLTRVEQKNLVTDYLIAQVTELLQLEEDEEFDLETGFFDLGLTSLMLTDFADILRKEVLSSFEVGMLFNYNNILDLMRFLHTCSIDFGYPTHAHKAHA